MSQTTSRTTKAERKEAAKQARLEAERRDAAAAARRRRLVQLGAVIAAAGVILVVAILASSGGGTKNASSGGAVNGATESREMLAGIPQRGNTLGNPKAPVTLVEFADPQCPYCSQYTLNEMPKLVEKYVRTGKVKMELRLMTFIGADSVRSARALEAAGLQNKMWNAADIMYFNHGQENSGYMDDAYLKRVMGAVPGLDVSRALSQRNSSQVTSALQEVNPLAQRYGVNSTPSFLVGPSGGSLAKVNAPSASADEIGKAIDKVATG